MPGGSCRDETLEARIERIRELDEEIEKKYREAEADRLAALQANAMVKTTAPKDEDWPKAHKYDKLDFTYDVQGEDGDESNKKTAGSVLTRNFKKFPEGQGPPADPTYNFLADAERDGSAKSLTNSVDGDKNTDWRASCSGGNSNRRGNNNNNSFNKGRANGKNNKNAVASTKQPQSQQRNNAGDGEQPSRKIERERNEVERVNRQKSLEGNWRCDNGKSVDEASNQSSANAINVIGAQSLIAPNNNHPDPRSPTSESVPKCNDNLDKVNTSKLANRLAPKLSELNIEKRGNITVSISQDGEVKSVRREYIHQCHYLHAYIIHRLFLSLHILQWNRLVQLELDVLVMA